MDQGHHQTSFVSEEAVYIFLQLPLLFHMVQRLNMDNYYTSSQLTRFLINRKTDCCSKLNSKEISPEIIKN